MRKRRNVIWSPSVAFALMLSISSAPCFAQSSTESQAEQTPEDLQKSMDAMKARLPHWFSQYQSNGAAMTSVPADGQPGADFFSHGADATSVSTMGPAAEFFSNGDSVTSVGGAAHPSAEYFTNGAAATNVASSGGEVGSFFANGAAATSVPKPGELGADYFSNGARATSVPAPGQPGSEYFSQGAEALSPTLRRDTRAPAPQPPEPAEHDERDRAEPEAHDHTAQAANPAAEDPNAAPEGEAEPPPVNAEQPPADSQPTVEATQEQSDRETSIAPATDGSGSGGPSAANGSRETRAGGSSEPGSMLAHAVRVFTLGVFSYVGALVALLALLAAGVARRIHRLRARKRRALEESSAGFDPARHNA